MYCEEDRFSSYVFVPHISQKSRTDKGSAYNISVRLHLICLWWKMNGFATQSWDLIVCSPLTQLIKKMTSDYTNILHCNSAVSSWNCWQYYSYLKYFPCFCWVERFMSSWCMDLVLMWIVLFSMCHITESPVTIKNDNQDPQVWFSWK